MPESVITYLNRVAGENGITHADAMAEEVEQPESSLQSEVTQETSEPVAVSYTHLTLPTKRIV